MCVFNHHDRTIHHRTDRNGDATQGHDVGIQPLVTHDDKGHQDAERQRNNRHECRSRVQQEQDDNQADDRQFLQQ